MSLIIGLVGAEEVISHLWKAPDETSEAIAGMDHPHFWGGIVCAAKPTKKVFWYYWVVVLVIFGSEGLLWQRKKKGKLLNLT